MDGEKTEGAENVDKIRDILFGAHMREYDARFARLEQDTKQRLDALEDYLKKEFASLAARLTADAHEERDLRKALAALLHDAAVKLHKD